MIKPQSIKLKGASSFQMLQKQAIKPSNLCQTEIKGKRCKNPVAGYSTLDPKRKQVRVEDSFCAACRASKPITFRQERKGTKEAFEESAAYSFMKDMSKATNLEVTEEIYQKVLTTWRASL